MSQEMKIKVDAETQNAAAGMDKLDKATDKVAASFEKVEKKAKLASDQVERLVRAQRILQKEFGPSVDEADTASFLQDFSRHKGFGAQRIRSFGGDFEAWYRGMGATFKRPAEAERQRRYVMGVGMQNTAYSREFGVPAFPGGGPPRPPGPPQEPSLLDKAKSSAFAFGKGMLAISGITSVMGMVGKAVDLATQEAVNLDNLKRRTGDVGVSFDDLKKSVRETAQGLGLTYVEASKLANQLAKTSGNLNHFGDLRTSAGFARSFGLDPAVATAFFGNERRFGVQGNTDAASRRFALILAETLEKSGFGANSEEILKAITDFTTQAARLTLSTPNVMEYMAHLAGLTGTGIPGLDPQGAAGIIGAADASVRRGGGMGEAGLNFSYAALMRGTKGLSNPVMAEALWQGGLFGTPAQVFGPNSALGKWAALHGANLPGLDGTTNLEKLRGQLRQQYGGSPFYLEALKNFFGLSSIEQAAGFDMMSPAALGNAENLVGRAGVRPEDIHVSAFQGIAKIAGAKSMGDLKSIMDATLARQDISNIDKQSLQRAFASGDFGVLQTALTRVVATHDQEGTKGKDARDSLADILNALTNAGSPLISIISDIRTFAAKAAGIDISGPKPASVPLIGLPDAYPALGPAPGGGVSVGRGEFHLRPEEQAALAAATGGDPAKMAIMRAILATENRGKPEPDNFALSNKGALGAFQFTAGAWSDFGEGNLGNATDFTKASRAASKMLDWIKAKYGTSDPDVLAAYWNGGDVAARAKLAGKKPPAKETQDYLDIFHGQLGNTPMPEGGNASTAASPQVRVGVTGEVMLPVRDQNGNTIGTANLRPYVQNPPAGN